MKKLLFAPVVAALLMLSSCSKKDSNDDAPEVLDPITIEMKADDTMRFIGTTDFNVKSGQDIILNLINIGQLPKEAMSHNVVVLKPGTDLGAFSLEALKEKDNDYIPANFSSSIVAHTRLLGPGESDSIEFKIEIPGVYNFVCSFPGHAATMKGSITVK